jgi:hypothetical protein
MRTGALAAVAALLAMSGLALLGLWLLGLDANATWTVLALAVGGSAKLSMPLPAGRIAAGAELQVIPLGVSVLGAVVLLAVVLLVRRPVDQRELVIRAGAAATTFLVLFAASLALDPRVDAVRTLAGLLVWVLVVAGLGLLCQVRAIRSVFVVLLVTMGAAMAAGAVAAIWGGARVLGAALLAGPNLVLIAFTRGLGVSWSVDTPVKLPIRLDSGQLGSLTANRWPLSVFAVVLVLLCALFAARDRSGGPFAGLVVAVLVPFAAGFAGASARIRLGPFGLGIGVRGELLPALGIGLVAGIATSLLVVGVRTWQGRRV